jgi:hypothetical protein
MRKYGESKTTRIMMATVLHVTSGLGLRKFQADGFLLTRVYRVMRGHHGCMLDCGWRKQPLDTEGSFIVLSADVAEQLFSRTLFHGGIVCPLLSQPAMSSACIWSCHQIWSRVQPPVCELSDALPSPHHKNQYIAKCYTGPWTFMHCLE